LTGSARRRFCQRTPAAQKRISSDRRTPVRPTGPREGRGSVANLEAGFEKAANATASRKFLEDAGEQVEIRKSKALRDDIDREYAAMGTVAKSLKLAPQWRSPGARAVPHPR
jgi:hypothetical protein